MEDGLPWHISELLGDLVEQRYGRIDLRVTLPHVRHIILQVDVVGIHHLTLKVG